MVAPKGAFRALAERFVCVRITDMRDVDVAWLRFDFDLTFAALLLHENGHIYHRFGGRTARDPLAWTSMAALEQVMRVTLREHARFDAKASVARPPRRTVSDLAVFAERDRKKRVSCVHCHNVHDFELAQARRDGTWKREQIWIWPGPERIGLRMDAVDQALVRAVAADSSAGKAGVEVGDRIVRAGESAVATVHDLQFALRAIPHAGGELPVVLARGKERKLVSIQLGSAWRETSVADYAWRPYKWNLAPAPGFGGPPLSAARKKRLGLDPKRFAFRVQYLVTWGPNAARGRNVARAGLRIGDIVTSYAGKSDFTSIDDFHAWVRLECKVGQVVEVAYLRKGEPATLRLKLID